MTTIAYHRPTKTLAADRRCCTANGMIAGPRTKVRVHKGHIFATAGSASAAEVVKDWIDRDCPKEGAGEAMFGSEAMIVKPDGVVVMLADKDWSIEIDDEFAAMGSGRRHAVTAMDMGGGAITAVHMASLRDPSTGDGIDFIVLGKDEIQRATVEEKGPGVSTEASTGA